MTSKINMSFTVPAWMLTPLASGEKPFFLTLDEVPENLDTATFIGTSDNKHAVLPAPVTLNVCWAERIEDPMGNTFVLLGLKVQAH